MIEDKEFAIQIGHRSIKHDVLCNYYDITSQHRNKDECLALDEKFIFRVWLHIYSSVFDELQISVKIVILADLSTMCDFVEKSAESHVRLLESLAL